MSCGNTLPVRGFPLYRRHGVCVCGTRTHSHISVSLYIYLYKTRTAPNRTRQESKIKSTNRVSQHTQEETDSSTGARRCGLVAMKQPQGRGGSRLALSTQNPNPHCWGPCEGRGIEGSQLCGPEIPGLTDMKRGKHGCRMAMKQFFSSLRKNTGSLFQSHFLYIQ